MEFGFTEEQELLRKTIRQFAERELAPCYAERGREDSDPHEVMRKMAQLGLLGMRAPVEYGGTEQSFVDFGIAVEEVSYGDYNVGAMVTGTGLSCELIKRFATPRVQREWLPGLISGDRMVGLALTEPHCGSDATALTTSAVREGDEFVITGEKSSISFHDADAQVMFVRTIPVPGAHGVSALLVPRDLPGIGLTLFKDLGMRPSRRGAIHLDAVHLPADHLLGEEGHGFYMVMNGFDYNRALLALQCIGGAQKTVDETVEYVKTRTAFGQPIARFEGVSFPMAEAFTLLEASRLLCYKALWLRDQGLPHAKEAAMAKWLGPKQAVEIIHQMLLLHGHAGYSDDYPIGQRLRDVIGHEIGDGTGEVMKMIVARETIGREARGY